MINNEVGILCNEQHGDIGLCTSVLKYKDLLWPGKKVIWYCNFAPEKVTYMDMLKFNDAISEIREWPKVWFKDIMDENFQIRHDKKHEFEQLKTLDVGYFPAPWAALPNNLFNNKNYSEIPRHIFGADPSWEWRPCLGFSNEEREMVKDFYSKLPHSKTVMLETQLRSAGNFNLSEDIIRNTMSLCRKKWGKCNFIFASKIDHTKFVDDTGVVSAADFTVRQTSLIHDQSDLFISVCSGITVASSCWGSKPVPRVEMCSVNTSYKNLCYGPTISVFCENWTEEQLKKGSEDAIIQILNKL